MSFDQVGFVWSTKPSRWNTLNIAFNYKKNRNFNNILNVAGDLDGMGSQNANSYMNLMDAQAANGSGDWLNNYSVSRLSTCCITSVWWVTRMVTSITTPLQNMG